MVLAPATTTEVAAAWLVVPMLRVEAVPLETPTLMLPVAADWLPVRLTVPEVMASPPV